MRLRVRSPEDEAFDGLTAEDIRRIRGGAEANRLRGPKYHSEPKSPRGGDPAPTTERANKRGRRA